MTKTPRPGITEILAAPPRPHAARPPLEIEVVTDGEGFTALEGEWEELYRESPVATPFQSWAWLYSWWEHYGDPYELRLVLMRDESGTLAGLLPLMLERRRGGGRLLFLGTEPTYNDLLAREGWEGEVAEAGVLALRGMGGWGVADLQELRPEAAAWEMIRRWRGWRASVWQSYCTLVRVEPWDELLAGLRKKYRSDARRALKKAGEEGIRRVHAGPDSAEAAGRRLVALNREQWRDRWQDTGPEHWSERFEEHICRAVHRMTAAGLGGVSEFWKDGRVVLSTFLIFGRDSVGVLMVGADKDALRQYSYSSLFVRDMIDLARERKTPYVNFFSGDDPYKLRWNPEVEPNRRAVLGKGLFAWLPHAGYLVLRQRAVRFARSEDAPAWARDAARRYRRLHYGAARLVRSELVPRRVASVVGRWFKEV